MNAEPGDIAPACPALPPEAGAADLEDLLSRVACGDEEAFAAVYGQTAGPVYGLACLLTSDARWSQEVAAQALTEVWRAAPRYDASADSARSWVMGIARRYVVSQVRAARSGGGYLDRARLDRQRAGHPTADLPAASGDLGPEQQAVLLALHRGYTQGEISDRLGLPPEAVAGLIRAGLLQAASR